MALPLSLFLVVLLCLALFTRLQWRRRPAHFFSTAQENHQHAKPLEFYAPMNRLLAEQDFRHLARQPGVSAQVVGRLYRQRRQIFRQYLQSLHLDFSLITDNIRGLMVASDVSRADLAVALIRSRVIFSLAIAMIQVRLFLHACGFHGQLIDISALIDGLAQMHRELALLTPVPAMAFEN